MKLNSKRLKDVMGSILWLALLERLARVVMLLQIMANDGLLGTLKSDICVNIESRKLASNISNKMQACS